MTDTQDVTKNITVNITVNGVNYLVRVQSYNFFNFSEPGLSLVTNIEILEDSWFVVGKFNGFCFNDGIPMIQKLDNASALKYSYHGQEGKKFAEDYLQQLTETQLIEGMQRTYCNCK